MSDIVQTILLGAACVGILFFVMWCIHLPLKNAAIVDVGWGLGFILLCLIYVIKGEGFNLRNTICLVLISLWGLRIVLFLLKRISSERREDKRYQKIREGFGQFAWFKFLFIFLFQAALEMIIAVPFLAISVNPNPALSIVEILGIIIFALGLLGETVSDEQLNSFKSDPANKGKVCNQGLWRYSRHPNYFFEWIIWVGIFIFSLGSPMGWTGIISPMLMYYLLMYVSGVPLAEEQSLQSRGEEYKKYQQVTNMFFPGPQKRMVNV